MATGPGPCRHQLWSVGAVVGDRVQFEEVCQRHIGRSTAEQGSALAVGDRAPRAGAGRRGHPSQVVEPDVRLLNRGQLRTGVRVEVAQEAVADAVGHGTQLFLDALDAATEGFSGGKRVIPGQRADVEAYGVLGGEPAHGA